MNNSFDGLFPSDYYTRMDSTWNAPEAHDWSALQNNTSGNCIQVVWNASGGDNFSYVAMDKAAIYNNVYLVGYVYSTFRPMFEIRD